MVMGTIHGEITRSCTFVSLSMCVHCVVQQHLWCMYADTQSAVVWIEKMVESLQHKHVM